jgi:hypothetical protein
MSRSFRQPAVLAPKRHLRSAAREVSRSIACKAGRRNRQRRKGHKAPARIADTDSTAFDLLPNLPSFSKGANISSACSQRDDGRRSLGGGGQSPPTPRIRRSGNEPWEIAVPRAKSTQRHSDNEKFRNGLNEPQGCKMLEWPLSMLRNSTTSKLNTRVRFPSPAPMFSNTSRILNFPFGQARCCSFGQMSVFRSHCAPLPGSVDDLPRGALGVLR